MIVLMHSLLEARFGARNGQNHNSTERNNLIKFRIDFPNTAGILSHLIFLVNKTLNKVFCFKQKKLRPKNLK
jgi:hypothetical protein